MHEPLVAACRPRRPASSAMPGRCDHCWYFGMLTVPSGFEVLSKCADRSCAASAVAYGAPPMAAPPSYASTSPASPASPSVMGFTMGSAPPQAAPAVYGPPPSTPSPSYQGVAPFTAPPPLFGPAAVMSAPPPTPAVYSSPAPLPVRAPPCHRCHHQCSNCLSKHCTSAQLQDSTQPITCQA